MSKPVFKFLGSMRKSSAIAIINEIYNFLLSDSSSADYSIRPMQLDSSDKTEFETFLSRFGNREKTSALKELNLVFDELTGFSFKTAKNNTDTLRLYSSNIISSASPQFYNNAVIAVGNSKLKDGFYREKAILKTQTLTPETQTGKTQNSEFHKFFVDELRDIYWAEKHLVKALSKMKNAANSQELAAAFYKHTAETETHIATLERAFGLLDEKPAAKKCDAMAGLLEKAEDIILDSERGTTIRDSGLILIAQKVEHYEIATYGVLCTLAATMGQQNVADLLQQTLDNEKAADRALTACAESLAVERAVAE